MELNKKLTIMVSSCDNYEDLWYPFFKMFDKYAGELKNCRIILNTECKNYSYKKLDIKTFSFYNDIVPWGQRFRKHLEQISTEYVLVLLDDFFIRNDVNIELIKKCLSYMENDCNIACFNFEPLDGADIESDDYKEFCSPRPRIDYQTNAQAAIWRVKDLYNSMLDIESPWEWEIYGNIRNQYTIKNKFYFLNSKFARPIDYGFNKEGMGVFRGQWVLDSVEHLFKENDITIDYSIRGVYCKSKNDFKSSFLYKILFKLSYPFRKKKLDLIQANYIKQYEEKYKLLVAPYIGDDNE